jgi:large subunit ribosomal protein L5
MMVKSRLGKLYFEKIRFELQKELGLKNLMQVPKISKIVLNMGVKGAVSDNKLIGSVKNILSDIACQKAVEKCAKNSIAGFKIRKGMPIGVATTLRGAKMYHFLDKLINVVLPMVRDFQGVRKKFDGWGNYNLGIKDWMVFPEVNYDKIDEFRGLNVTIQITSSNDEQSFVLLKKLNMPFRQNAVS